MPFAKSSHRSALAPSRRWMPLAVLLVSLVAAACGDDGTGPGVEDGTEVTVVLNSIDLSLSVLPVDSPGVTHPPIGLGPDGSPVGFAIRDDLAAVPMGFVPALVVVDLSAGSVLRTVGLPQGSGATGAAFVNDSIVLVANPNLDTVVPVNVLRGTVAEQIEVGGYPQAVAVAGDRLLVLNAELGADFLPTGPGTVTVLDRDDLGVLGTVPLSGTNPGAAVTAADGRVWVVNSGSFGAADGSLSLVDPSAAEETGHWSGFGEFPFGAALGGNGRLHVGSFAYGLAVWDTDARSFLRPPDAAVEPEGMPSVSGVAFDPEGRLYTLRPDCSAPSVALRLDPSYEPEASWPVGTCPIAVAFTVVGG